MIRSADDLFFDTPEGQEVIAEFLALAPALNYPGHVEGPASTSWDDVDYVVGGKWKIRFAKLVPDEGYRFYDAQFYIIGSRYGEIASYNGTNNHEDSCLGCEVVGLELDQVATADPSAEDYSLARVVAELGVGCDTFHSPGSAHVDQPLKENGLTLLITL